MYCQRDRKLIFKCTKWGSGTEDATSLTRKEYPQQSFSSITQKLLSLIFNFWLCFFFLSVYSTTTRYSFLGLRLFDHLWYGTFRTVFFYDSFCKQFTAIFLVPLSCLFSAVYRYRISLFDLIYSSVVPFVSCAIFNILINSAHAFHEFFAWLPLIIFPELSHILVRVFLGLILLLFF